jgi:hypothetical protein
MYGLLPTEELFNSLPTPVIDLVGDAVPASWTSRYGNTINTYSELSDFLTGQEGRQNPEISDTKKPLVLSGTLLEQAKSVHNVLTTFTPAPDTEVIQIAGWGLYTKNGLTLETEKKCRPTITGLSIQCDYYSDTTIVDRLTYRGDKTVVTESALAMSEGTQVKRWWVDLQRYNVSGLFASTLNPFIKCLFQNTVCDTSADYISSTEPPPLTTLVKKYQIHSPLHLTVTDNQGNITGWDPATGKVVENIKSSQYLETGEIKTVIIPEGTEHTVMLKAYEEGSFALVEETITGDTVIETTKAEAIPVLTGSVVTVTPSNITEPLKIDIDFNNDEVVDDALELEPGETKEYIPLTPAVENTDSTLLIRLNLASKELSLQGKEGQAEQVNFDDATKTITVVKDDEVILTIPLSFYQKTNKKLEYAFDTIIRGTNTEKIPRVHVQYWYRNKNKPFTSKINFRNQRTVELQSYSKKNYTTVVDKIKNKKPKKYKLPGYKVPGILITNEKVEIKY